MDFELDEQQRTLRDEARRFLEAEAPISYARAMMDDARGWRDDVHAKMAALGWYALPFDDAHGGLGMDFVSLALLLAEMGRVVLPGPYLATVLLGGLAVARAGSDEQRARLLPAICSGERTATLARADGRFTIDGATADIVVHETADGFALAEPAARAPVATLDQTRRAADLTFGAGAEPMPGARGTLGDAIVVGLAAEVLGICERVTEITVAYAEERHQFGRPIGSFQAVKHRAADMAVDLESLRNAVYYAAWAVAREHPDASLVASMAKATAADIGVRLTRSAIQIHGGIGFTWEHDLHLFHKRALLDAALFGDATEHRERVAVLLATRRQA